MAQDKVASLLARQVLLDDMYKNPSALHIMESIDATLDHFERQALAEMVGPGKSREFMAGAAHSLRKVKAKLKKERERNWEDLNNAQS